MLKGSQLQYYLGSASTGVSWKIIILEKQTVSNVLQELQKRTYYYYYFFFILASTQYVERLKA